MHWIDPQPFPFFGRFVQGANISTQLWFVQMKPVFGTRFGGAVGSILEPQTDVEVGVRAFGEFSVVVTDPVALVRAIDGGGGDATAILAWVGACIMKKLKELLGSMSAEGEKFLAPPAMKTISEKLPPMVDEVERAGLKVEGIASIQLLVSDEDMAAMKEAGAAKARAAIAARSAQKVCSRCQTAHEGGRFCVSCGTPLA